LIRIGTIETLKIEGDVSGQGVNTIQLAESVEVEISNEKESRNGTITKISHVVE